MKRAKDLSLRMGPLSKLAVSLVLPVLIFSCGDSSAPVLIDPLHSPEPGQASPSVVVEIALADSPAFDLLPTRVNGADVAAQFNDDAGDNADEPLIIPTGRVRLVYTNTGTIIHNLQVRSASGGRSILESPIARPKDMGEVELELAPGRYWLACPILGHDRLGMLRPLVVTE